MTKISNLLAVFVLLALPLSSAPSIADESGSIVVLSSSNTIVLNSEVDGESVGSVLDAAAKLDKEASPGFVDRAVHAIRGGKPESKKIYLYLNTPGGSVQSGLELIEGLNGLKRPVSTITGFAASMGMQIAQGVNGDRFIMQHGVMMSHRGTGEFQGQFGGLEPSQSYNRYRIWAQRLKEMDEQTVKRSKGKQTLLSYQKAYNEELWVTGSEAVAQGYADKIVTIRCDQTLAGAETHMLVFMGIPVYYDLDKCPINSSPRNIRLELFTNHGYMSITEFKTAHGGFGALCLQESVKDTKKVCTVDTTVSYEKLEQIKAQFIDLFDNKRNHVVPMSL
jgi:ATP-dependent protease ClpP protease subunit